MKEYPMLKLENQLCFPLYAASREVVRLYYPYLSQYDLTYTQYIALMVLWDKGMTTVKDLGNRLYLDSGTLTPLLKSLEKKGYVTKHRDEKDERSVIVSITKEGLDLRDKLADLPANVGNCVSLNHEDAVALYNLLYKILGNLK